MLNNVSQSGLLPDPLTIEGVQYDGDRKQQLATELPDISIDVVCMDGPDGAPVTPTAGMFQIYYQDVRDGGFKRGPAIQAVRCGGSSMPDGQAAGAVLQANAIAIRVVPQGVTGAAAYRVWVRQNLLGAVSTPPAARETLDGLLTAFGEVAVAESQPVVQLLSRNGLTSEIEALGRDGGTVVSEDGLIRVISGTDPVGLASINARRVIAYRAGQGVKALFTAVFGDPQPGTLQLAGIDNPTDGLNFGYAGTTFGIIRRARGLQEIRELTVAAPAAGAETATVTVSGNVVLVPITAGTVEHNAHEIATALNASLAVNQEWQFEANGAVVVAESLGPGPSPGVFAFSSTGTAVATWALIVAALPALTQVIPQSQWNIDTVPWLDPSAGNVYRIRMQYLGFGAIEFAVEEPETGAFVDVHRIPYANSEPLPSLGDPGLRPSLIALNTGSTTGVTLASASMAGFNEGMVVALSQPRVAVAQNAGVTNVERPIVSIRSRLVGLTDAANNNETAVLNLLAATTATGGMLFRVYVNAVLTEPRWQYVDKDESVSSVDTAATAVVGGQPVTALIVAENDTETLDLEGLFLQSGDWVTITAQRVSAAAGALGAVTLQYREDI